MFDILDAIIVACAHAIARVVAGIVRLVVYVQFVAILALVVIVIGAAGMAVWHWFT